MRPQGQLKGGFYPVPPEALAEALELLAPCDHKQAVLIDPCCGRGSAIAQIHGRVGGKLYAIELEEGRAAEAALNLLPLGGQVIGPADFLNCTITPAGSFSLAWVNPPYSDEIGGGGRIELSFVQRATQLLRPKGVMMLACPEEVARSREVAAHFFSWYEQIGISKYKEGFRQYKEVIVWGVKRDHAVEPSDGMAKGVSHQIAPGTYHIPPATGPKRFEKTRYTQLELLKAMGASPLQRLFKPPAPAAMARPPLELSKGQMSLVLAGGYLNGPIQKPGEKPILIKATPFKEEYQKSSEVEVRNEGQDSEKEVQVTVLSERIKLKVRVAEQSGVIHEVK